eukprot:jgi/Psemu1/3114/gm1.3114_g
MFDEKGEADITLAEVLRYNESTRLKNSEVEETLIKMTTQEKQIGKPEDDFQTKKNSLTSIIEQISAKKYIPQTKGAESIFKVLETFCRYMRLKHQYQLPTEIWMKIAMQKDSDSYSKLVGQEERWIDFKQHWNTRLKILYQAVLSKELEDGTENIKGNCR